MSLLYSNENFIFAFSQAFSASSAVAAAKKNNMSLSMHCSLVLRMILNVEPCDFEIIVIVTNLDCYV